MKIFILCVFLIVYYACITNGFGEGIPKVFLYKGIDCKHDKDANLNVSLVKVYFYDFSKNMVKSFPIAEAGNDILKIPDLKIKRKFIIFVAGYRSNITKNTEERVRNAFRDLPNSYLIILDHSPYTNSKGGNRKGYIRSVRYVFYIGKALGIMLSTLARRISAKNMHCIGHSLGGQMLGYTGQTFLTITGKKLWRITALDPAGPCFSNTVVEDQVRSGVAEYVEVYHCNAGVLGSNRVLADVDFFLNNNGTSQPNCPSGALNLIKGPKCSHNKCVETWTASVKHRGWFSAWRCDSYEMFTKMRCECNGVSVAGFWNPGNAFGIYYLSTEGYGLNSHNGTNKKRN